MAEKSQKLVRRAGVGPEPGGGGGLAGASGTDDAWLTGSGEGGRQHPEGGHRQTQVPDCGVSRGAEESDGEDEGERQEHQDLNCKD